jgi:hypothetical protein
MIIFGTYFGGKIRRLDDQWVESKYALLMVPLVPISSMFVTSSSFNERRGFNMPMDMRSVGHGYLRFFLLIVSMAALYACTSSDFNEEHPILLAIILILSVSALAWSHISCTADKSADLIDRKKLGAILGINALPEWLEENKRKDIAYNLENRIVAEFGHKDLNKLIAIPNFTQAQLALLFAYLRYEVVVAYGNVALEQAYFAIDDRYNQMLQSADGDILSAISKVKGKDISDSMEQDFE